MTYATAKSLQSCPTLCDPIDGSPPGSAIPGILQARTLEWVAISFSNAWKWKVKVKSISRIRLLVTPWTAAYQAPPSMGIFQARVLEWGAILLGLRLSTGEGRVNFSIGATMLMLSFLCRWILIFISSIYVVFKTSTCIRLVRKPEILEPLPFPLPRIICFQYLLPIFK